jgi:hypothetical protein
MRALRWADIGHDAIHVIGKGGHHRLVPLHPALRHEIDLELRRRAAGGRGSGWTPQSATTDGHVFLDDRGWPFTAVPRGVVGFWG